jgi:glutamine synthetase
MFLPAAVRYLNELAQTFEHSKAMGLKSVGVGKTATAVGGLIDELRDALDKLIEQNAELGGDDVHSKAHHMRDNIIPAMNAVRKVVDKLEKVVPDDLWPVPTYRDMLFVK